MFTATYLIVASTGTYVGKGMSKSPKAAHRDAISRCWEALREGDVKAKYCSGIAVEQWSMRLNGRLVGSECRM